jgi:peptide deformylase
MASTTKGSPRGSRKERREEERADRIEALRQLALGQIRRYPDPVLRERAREVDEFSDDLRALVGRMGRVMEDAHGVGLAATQLGLLRRILVFRANDEDALGVLINPVIVEQSEETTSEGEGCLSLPEVHVPVERFATIVVEGVDADGDDVRIEAEGLQSRVIQHELDHLDGVLIFDRTTPEARREAMRALRPRPDERG